MKYPFVKVGHRNGHVFLRIVGKTVTQMIKLTPAEAYGLGEELQEAGFSAGHNRIKLEPLKLAKETPPCPTSTP